MACNGSCDCAACGPASGRSGASTIWADGSVGGAASCGCEAWVGPPSHERMPHPRAGRTRPADRAGGDVGRRQTRVPGDNAPSDGDVRVFDLRPRVPVRRERAANAGPHTTQASAPRGVAPGTYGDPGALAPPQAVPPRRTPEDIEAERRLIGEGGGVGESGALATDYLEAARMSPSELRAPEEQQPSGSKPAAGQGIPPLAPPDKYAALAEFGMSRGGKGGGGSRRGGTLYVDSGGYVHRDAKVAPPATHSTFTPPWSSADLLDAMLGYAAPRGLDAESMEVSSVDVPTIPARDCDCECKCVDAPSTLAEFAVLGGIGVAGPSVLQPPYFIVGAIPATSLNATVVMAPGAQSPIAIGPSAIGSRVGAKGVLSSSANPTTALINSLTPAAPFGRAATTNPFPPSVSGPTSPEPGNALAEAVTNGSLVGTMLPRAGQTLSGALERAASSVPSGLGGPVPSKGRASPLGAPSAAESTPPAGSDSGKPADPAGRSGPPTPASKGGPAGTPGDPPVNEPPKPKKKKTSEKTDYEKSLDDTDGGGAAKGMKGEIAEEARPPASIQPPPPRNRPAPAPKSPPLHPSGSIPGSPLALVAEYSTQRVHWKGRASQVPATWQPTTPPGRPSRPAAGRTALTRHVQP